MPAVIIDVRNAVAEDLTAAAAASELSKSFVATAKFRPEFKVPELKDLRVTCIGSGDESEREDRELFQHDYTISVMIQQHAGDDEETRCAELVLLGQR